MQHAEAALLAILVAGCAELPPPETTDVVSVELFTAFCDPQSDPEESFLAPGTVPTLRWNILCNRDGVEPAWLAVKVSHWDDRADDWWNVWYADPSLRETTYGETPLPGVDDENNPFFPDALPRVAPRELAPGSYRLEVWAVPTDLVDAVIGEGRFTVLDE